MPPEFQYWLLLKDEIRPKSVNPTKVGCVASPVIGISQTMFSSFPILTASVRLLALSLARIFET